MYYKHLLTSVYPLTAVLWAPFRGCSVAAQRMRPGLSLEGEPGQQGYSREQYAATLDCSSTAASTARFCQRECCRKSCVEQDTRNAWLALSPSSRVTDCSWRAVLWREGEGREASATSYGTYNAINVYSYTLESTRSRTLDSMKRKIRAHPPVVSVEFVQAHERKRHWSMQDSLLKQ